MNIAFMLAAVALAQQPAMPTEAGGVAKNAEVRCATDSSPRVLPETAEGTFVQRKVLADVDVTLVSKGTFRFGRDRFFEWNTREPMPSVFYATPTNYSITVNGKTTARPLEVNVSSVEQLFSIREMKGFVKEVKARPETGFPTRVDVSFTNGDRLEIELVRIR